MRPALDLLSHITEKNMRVKKRLIPSAEITANVAVSSGSSSVVTDLNHDKPFETK